jgi:hypothetical protein
MGENTSLLGTDRHLGHHRVVAILALKLVLGLLGIVLGLAGFLLFTVAPVLLLGWLVMKAWQAFTARPTEPDARKSRRARPAGSHQEDLCVSRRGRAWARPSGRRSSADSPVPSDAPSGRPATAAPPRSRKTVAHVQHPKMHHPAGPQSGIG